MSSRLERLREQLAEPFLVTNPVNVRYLTGFRSTNPALLVEDGRVRLFSDFRYAEAGRAVDGVEFVETKRALIKDLASRLSGRIAFEAEHVTYAQYQTLQADGLEPVPRSNVVERLRAVKDEQEIASITRAASVADEVFAALAEQQFAGRTERDVAWQIEQLFHEHGAEGLAFPVVVATGENGARPHATPGERVIETGSTVVVDAGCVVDGYCSDCTRTFAVGSLPDRLREAYAACLEGQQAGLAGVRPGVSGVDADMSARAPIADRGFGEEFGHGLGHGVGLLVHEAPRLSTESVDVLEAGNVVTVEPGIYLEGVGGIRIEDLVVVREDGAEVLSTFTKELVSVG